MGWDLAQINVGRLRAPIDDPLVADFVDQLDEINALADVAPGFVWRLQTDEGNATYLQPTDDELLIVNMSVWTSVEALADYVYRSAHLEVMRRRREWFEQLGSAHLALWWVPAGERPTAAEGLARVAHLDAHGPSSHAFTFRRRFASTGEPLERESTSRDACPA